MSGGAYTTNNHRPVYYASIEDFVADPDALDLLVQDLAAIGYANDAAALTDELLIMVRQFTIRANIRLEKLSSIWRALDYWKCQDDGEDGFKANLDEWRKSFDG